MGGESLISTLNVSPRGERNRKYCAIHCPLDYFLICSSLTTTITNADILKGYKTDHSVITIHVANNNKPSGLGFWKLNISFLLDSEYIELIKKPSMQLQRSTETMMMYMLSSSGRCRFALAR